MTDVELLVLTETLPEDFKTVLKEILARLATPVVDVPTLTQTVV